MVDGRAVRACRTPASGAAGKDVLTIEGLGSPASPHALQQAFAVADAVQCGFCTPGMIMAAAALLERNPRPSRSEIVRWARQQPLSLHGLPQHRGRDRMGGQRAGGPRRGQVADRDRDERARAPRRSPASAGHVRTDALDKATGRALYAADLAVDGMLHARVLRSPHAHAEIVRIDTERARRLPGVEAILTARDVPARTATGAR